MPDFFSGLGSGFTDAPSFVRRVLDGYIRIPRRLFIQFAQISVVRSAGFRCCSGRVQGLTDFSIYRLNAPAGPRHLQPIAPRRNRVRAIRGRFEAPTIQIDARKSPPSKIALVGERVSCVMLAALTQLEDRECDLELVSTDRACRKSSTQGAFANLPRSRARTWRAVVALGCALFSMPVWAQTPTEPGTNPARSAPPQPQAKAVVRLKTPDAAVRLYAADCRILCSVSALFAPTVERDRVAAIPITNLSTPDVTVSARFVPTNALAMSNEVQLELDALAQPKNMLSATNATISVTSGETAQLKLNLQSTRLPAGLYTGQIEFRAKPQTGNADSLMQVATIEIRVRDSAIWALLTVVLGIVLGRVAQLVYDPQVIAKLQLLDWIHQLDTKIAGVRDDDTRAKLTAQLGVLRNQLFSRGVEVAMLQTAFRTLENAVDAAIGGPAVPAIAPPGAPPLDGKQGDRIGTRVGAGISQVLRVLAGVTPLPLQGVYDWLLPVFVLLTLIALTMVFMLQQYGGTGAAETFGAGGLADYAGLFLAGVASEAIAGGLRAVKLR